MADENVESITAESDEMPPSEEAITTEVSESCTDVAENSPEDVQWSPIAEESGIIARVSGLLFVTTRPVSFNSIKQAVNASPEEVEAAIDEVRDLYSDEMHGFSLHEVAGGFQFRTAPGVSATIRRHKPPKQRRISKAAAETLAIIAYKQPVQRAEIENIRGVDALPTLKTLLDNKLVRIVGHEDSVGQPGLYGTTPEFLEIFGLNDLTDLPSIRELTELARDPGEAESENEQLSSDENDDHEMELSSELSSEDTQLH